MRRGASVKQVNVEGENLRDLTKDILLCKGRKQAFEGLLNVNKERTAEMAAR